MGVASVRGRLKQEDTDVLQGSAVFSANDSPEINPFAFSTELSTGRLCHVHGGGCQTVAARR